MIRKLIDRYKSWNRERIRRRRARAILKDDLPERRNFPDPGITAERILLIDALFGLGDSLYANGLAVALSKAGKIVTVVTLNRTLVIYKGNAHLDGLYSLESEDDLTEVARKTFDIVVDLSYIELDRWPLRVALMRRIPAFTVSCSLRAAWSKAVNRVIDYSRLVHMSERMDHVFYELTGIHAPHGRVFPVFGDGAYGKSTNVGNTIYVNTVALEDDRCFSEHQIKAIADWFEAQKRYVGIFYVPAEMPLSEGAYVKRMPSGSYDKLVECLKSVKAVVTPDTSVTHLSSALNIPAVVIYCGGEMEYYGHAQMWETWAPLSDYSQIIKSRGRDNEPVPRAGFPVSSVPAQEIIAELDAVLHDVNHIAPKNIT